MPDQHNVWKSTSPLHTCYLPQATQISPWVVTMDALAPFACEAPPQEPLVLPHLREEPSVRAASTFDIKLTVDIIPEGLQRGGRVTVSNLKYMWVQTAELCVGHARVNNGL